MTRLGWQPGIDFEVYGRGPYTWEMFYQDKLLSWAEREADRIEVQANAVQEENDRLHKLVDDLRQGDGHEVCRADQEQIDTILFHTIGRSYADDLAEGVKRNGCAPGNSARRAASAGTAARHMFERQLLRPIVRPRAAHMAAALQICHQ